MQDVPVWNIIKKFIGKDLRYVSLPVSLNEPLSVLQKTCENLTLSGARLFERAAETDDPVLRQAFAVIGLATFTANAKYRKKKPFNPMLGETFEMVTENYRYLAEKVMHNPEQITALSLEGKNYHLYQYQLAKPQFRLNYGKGAMHIQFKGQTDIYFKNYDEHISTNRQSIWLKNLIIGATHVDLDDTLESVNHKSGERVVI